LLRVSYCSLSSIVHPILRLTVLLIHLSLTIESQHIYLYSCCNIHGNFDQKNDALEHVLLILIGINVKSHTYNVLYEEGIMDTSHIMNITENELSLYNANVVDDKGIIIKRAKMIPRFHQASIRLMGAMLINLQEEKGSALEDDEIMKITKAEFNTYQTSKTNSILSTIE
jgi:hypothetical protein